MTHLYVNTATGNNSWDGTSATFVSGSIGPKATLAGAEAILPATFTDSITIHCAGATADTAACTISGMTTYSDKTLTIEGDATSGVWDDTKYHLVTTGGSAMSVAEDYVDLSRLQVKVVAGSTTALFGIRFEAQTAAANAHVVDRCLVWMTSDGTQGSCRGIMDNDTDTVLTIRNSWITGAKANTDGHGVYASGTVTIENCTIENCTKGVYRVSGTCTVTNSAIFNNTDDLLGTLTATYCAIDDADSFTGKVDISPGGTEATDWAAAFTDYTSQNYGVKDTGSVLYDAGTDLSGSFTTDIAGATRSTWDIGAFEYVVTVQFARPSSDIADGNWLNQAGSATDLFESINETAALLSDADFIKSGTIPTDDACTVGLSPITTPQAGTVTLRVRAAWL